MGKMNLSVSCPLKDSLSVLICNPVRLSPLPWAAEGVEELPFAHCFLNTLRQLMCIILLASSFQDERTDT